jgi:RND family efflux transporter MFP subunit
VLFYAALLAGAAWYIACVLAPGFKSPRSRVYSGPLGYPAVMRLLGNPIEVETASVEVRAMVRTLSAEGYVGYLNEVPIRSEVLGIVTDIRVEPGQEVRPGQRLIRLNTGEHTTRTDELQLKLRRVAVELAKVDLDRHRKLVQSTAASMKEFEAAQLRYQQAVTALELAEENYKNSLLSRSQIVVEGAAAVGKAGRDRFVDILATTAGTVFERNVQLGENLTALTAEKSLLLIGDRLVFQADFDQRFADSIRLGDRGKFHLRAYPGLTFDAEVVRIGHEVKPDNQKSASHGRFLDTFRVWLAVGGEASGGKKLIRGMNGYCIFQRPYTAPAIPESALMRYSGRTGTVLVVDATNHLQVRSVTYTGTDDGWVAIDSGLAKGERVVVEGQVALKPGDEVCVRAE